MTEKTPSQSNSKPFTLLQTELASSLTNNNSQLPSKPQTSSNASNDPSIRANTTTMGFLEQITSIPDKTSDSLSQKGLSRFLPFYESYKDFSEKKRKLQKLSQNLKYAGWANTDDFDMYKFNLMATVGILGFAYIGLRVLKKTVLGLSSLWVCVW